MYENVYTIIPSKILFLFNIKNVLSVYIVDISTPIKI